MELRVLGAIAAVFFALSGSALAAQPAAALVPQGGTAHRPISSASRQIEALCGQTVHTIANPTHAKLNACVVPRGHSVIDVTYYQNASSVGGTALAAYPEATIRFGVARNLEVFMDAPSDVAKSGVDGLGVFYFTHPGFGLKASLKQTRVFASSFSVESRPQLNALAHLSLVPMAEAALTGSWAPPRSNLILTAQAGAFWFRQRGMGHAQRTAATFALAVTAPVARKTWLTLQLRSISAAAMNSGAQSSGTLSVQHEFGRNVLISAQLGTAFNAAGHSKAHYLGFGFTIRR
ncbi:MAG TPA: hypothetical protein VFO29_09345 [Candidatus Rubrimentiphilum sp.]|nr:hypothetical protein [Candidatus Rubrimentiphilum sp.]